MPHDRCDICMNVETELVNVQSSVMMLQFDCRIHEIIHSSNLLRILNAGSPRLRSPLPR